MSARRARQPLMRSHESRLARRCPQPAGSMSGAIWIHLLPRRWGEVALDRTGARPKIRAAVLAPVAKSVDAADSKSVGRKAVLVRVRPGAPLPEHTAATGELLCPQDVRKMPKAKAGAYFSATSSRSARTATASSTAAAATQAVVGRVRNPLPAEHPAYALIGRVAAEWAQLEHALDIIIWEMAGTPFYVGSCITGQMVGHWPRFRAIIALGTIRKLSKPLLKVVNKTGETASELAQLRNRIVHDAWYTEEEPGALAAQYRSILPKQVIFGLEDVTEDFVNDLIGKIVIKREQVFELRARIKVELQASR